MKHRQFEVLFDQPHAMAAILDPQGHIQRLNAMAQAFVPGQEDILGEPLSDTPWVINSPTSAEKLNDRLSHVREGETLRYEKRCQHPDKGTVMLDVTLQPVVDAQDTVDSIILFARDITDRWRRRQELERVRDRMELALAVTDSLLWTIDLETETLTDMHGPLLQKYDLDPVTECDTDPFEDGEVLTAFGRLIHPDDIESVKQAYRAVRQGTTETLDLTFRTNPDQGDLHWIDATGTVKEQDGRRFLVGLTTNITEQKRRQAELERQNERLDAFASVVSHDLRNPVSIAAGYLELARETGDPAHFDRIEAALDRMETLIDDLLALARNGEEELDLEPVTLQQLARESWTGIQTADATLALDLAEQTIVADPSQLKQVLKNLFRNAVEHAGTDVTVTVGWLSDAEGFYIEDDGPGIPESERAAVLDAGYSTQEDGTGLGLTIIDTIVDAHGWELTVTEGTAGGARFEITGIDTE